MLKKYILMGILFIAIFMVAAVSIFASSVLVSDVNSGGKFFSFVQLTDLHIGEGVDDYGTAGFNDSPPVGDVGVPAQRLREAVNWINANKSTYNLSFVIITGDITSSGERSEFYKAKEILDSLTIPYVPLIGNHDIWPYTATTEAESAYGDVYFMETFSILFDNLKYQFTEWNDGTRLNRVWNSENSCYSYFQNFAFSYRGYHFICADFNTRSHAIAGEKGVLAEADLYNITGGTWPWFKSHYNSYPVKGSDNMLTFAHHPLTKDVYNGVYSFSYGEYDTVASFLNDNGNKYYTGLWCAGHMHRNSTYGIKTLSLFSTICPGIETAAAKDGNLRVVNVWGAI